MVLQIVKLLDATGTVLTTTSPLVQGYATAAGLAEPGTTGGNCSIAPASRSDCGMPIGKNQQSCEAGGCCWAPVNPNPGNAPWCFHPSGPPGPPPPPPPPPGPPGPCIGKAYPGVDVTSGDHIASEPTGLLPSQTACCAACDSAPECQSWVWATAGHESNGLNCWLLTGVTSTKSIPDGSRVFGVTRGPTPPLPPPPPPQLAATFSASTTAKYYGAGASKSTSTTLSMTASNPHVANTEFFTPHYWSTDGYSILTASSMRHMDGDIQVHSHAQSVHS